ncbi:hypothetical protein L7F22_019380 [Adiantum nelumboides]|nr:hypothetical protein [Adiantum nelumboides]
MAEEEEEKVSFANLRSRFEALAAKPEPPINKPLPLTHPVPSSSSTNTINHPDTNGYLKAFENPPPIVPRRPLTPSKSLPSVSNFPGALEALAYADTPPSRSGTPAAPSPPPPPIPIRPSKLQIPSNLPNTTSISLDEGSDLYSAPSERPPPVPLQKAADEHAKFMASRHRTHSTSEALRVLQSASHKLTHLGRHASEHRRPDDGSGNSTPNDFDSPAFNPITSPPNGGNDILPPPPRRMLQPKPKHADSGNRSPSFNESYSNSNKSLPPLLTGEEVESSSDTEEEVMSAYPYESKPVPNTPDELPDASRANRRPPDYIPPRVIPSKGGHTSAVAIHKDIVVVGHHDKLRFHVANGGRDPFVQHISLGQERRENRLSALCFPSRGNGRYLWCGTKEGDMFEYDLEGMRVKSNRTNAHTGPVLVLQRVKNDMISIDESGKICTWLAKDQSSPSLKDAPVTQRIAIERYSCVFVLGEEVWVASANDVSGSTTRTPKVRIYRPFTIDKPFNANSRPVGIPENVGPSHIGLISSAAIVPLQPDYVFLGHQSGHISVWSRFTYSCVHVQQLNMAGVTSLCGVRGHFLWAGSRHGEIRIFDVREQPWQAIKIWQANKAGAVIQLIVDPSPIDDGKLQVLSTSLEGEIHIWDGLLKTDWMTVELERRLTEYSTFRTLKTFHLTFNIDAATVMDFEGHELPGMELLQEHEMPDVIIIGFQELVDLGDTRIMAKSLILGGGRRSKQADAGERLSHQARAWTQRLSVEVQRRFPGFKLLLQDSLVGLYTAIFVKESELPAIRDPGIATIKTGFGGRMGNKGAIVASMRIDDTPLAWINCHLAAGQRHTRQRIADLVNIFESTLSQKVSNQRLDYEVDAYAGGGDGSMILPDHEIVFLSGDLNYRVDLRREQCFDLIRREDWQGLIAKDQLKRQLEENSGHRLKPFREAMIQFAPTYKYDRQTDSFDSSEKQRVPAYCDRILWYSRSEDAHAIQCLQYTSQPHIKMSDHRPVVGRFSFQIRKADPIRRKAVLDELLVDWQIAQAERLRAAREYYMSS